ncbi:MAG: DUF616 domain-containing protein [Oscillospiraceae bacterium]|jgi:hypothetical protein|nr:DUF616 domain-containing protein [Oscillospiraceae bacterium]
METEQYERNLIYLNEKRLEVTNSREYFWGKKLLKYGNYFKQLRFRSAIKEFSHDVYAYFNKKVDIHKIIDFSQGAITSFKKKVVVYTSIYGSYDLILEPLTVDSNCEYFIFTDQKVASNSVWKLADDSKMPKECDTPAKKNRYVKMFPHKFFDCDYSIYLDGNLQIVGHPSLLVQREIETCLTGIEMHLAPRENCIYEEAKTVCHVGKINKSEMNQVLKMYKENGMPRHFGMCECNVIVRNHNNDNYQKIMENWWELYLQGVKRDQLYFTYVIYKQGYQFSDIINFGASVNQNPLFLRKEHK